uniref:Uncharacterized protein n=1 Tax=Podarcis muralis TaxID=64176 RepID=A0A670JIE5_PODMU
MTSKEPGIGSLLTMFLQMRQQFKEDEKAYKRKLQAYQDGQQRQAQLVQKMQNKVGGITLNRWEDGGVSQTDSIKTQQWGLLQKFSIRFVGPVFLI